MGAYDLQIALEEMGKVENNESPSYEEIEAEYQRERQQEADDNARYAELLQLEIDNSPTNDLDSDELIGDNPDDMVF